MFRQKKHLNNGSIIKQFDPKQEKSFEKPLLKDKKEEGIDVGRNLSESSPEVYSSSFEH